MPTLCDCDCPEHCGAKELNETEAAFRNWMFRSEVPYLFICQTDGVKEEARNESVRAIYGRRRWKRADFLLQAAESTVLAIEIKYLPNFKQGSVLDLTEMKRALTFARGFGAELFIVGYANNDYSMSYWLHSCELLVKTRADVLHHEGKLEWIGRTGVKIDSSAWLPIQTREVIFSEVWPKISKLRSYPNNR